jgi:hypothetical protein
MSRWPFGVMQQSLKETINVSNICVVHLVRKKNGLIPFSNFLNSYLKNPAGVEHDLLIIYKGFSRKGGIDPYEKLLKEVPHSYLMVADFGFDLRPYFIAAKKYKSEYFCFLNSFSVILDKDWLLKLYTQIAKPGIGLAGATGSWGSISSGAQTRQYATYEKVARFIIRKWRSIYFYPFPNHHLRTNGFMVARTTWLKVRNGVILNKMHAYRLESGKDSITNQIENMGLRSIVVGKDGKGYEKSEWNISNTFWRGSQSNLLIADNQTRKFALENYEWRRKWELFAWGELINTPQQNSKSDTP